MTRWRPPDLTAAERAALDALDDPACWLPREPPAVGRVADEEAKPKRKGTDPDQLMLLEVDGGDDRPGRLPGGLRWAVKGGAS